MAKLHIHPVGLILLLLGLASWVVALAGLAASTKFCNDNSSDTDLMSCTQTYQQDWWAVFFELILILVMLFTCFLNIFPKAQFIYMAYLVMVTGLLTFTTRKMFTNSFNRGWLAEDLDSKAYDAAAVGCMFCCIVNYGLIIFIGHGATKATSPAAGGFTNVSTTAPATGMGPTAIGSNGLSQEKPPLPPQNY